MNFTNAQKKAISHREGHLHLIACAGSGKTEVLANRISSLLDPKLKPRYEPKNIVAFTFTEKAAGELKGRTLDRVQEKLGNMQGLAEMFVGTIHGFCLAMLQTEVPEYLKFGVLNQVQQALFVDRHSKKSGLTTTLDLQGDALRRYVDTDRYIETLSILREAKIPPKKLAGTSVKAGLDAYEALLEEKRHFDYTAILARAVHEVGSNAALRRRLKDRVKQVIVDEYQDVNALQEQLIRALAELGASICVVGDDDQTVYQWRGSNVANIRSFTDRYPKVAQVTLNDNFRSSRGIVETARDFIEQNSERLPKKMESTDAQPTIAGEIAALTFDDPEAEAAFLVKSIKELVGVRFDEEGKPPRGMTYSDMAILIRVRKSAGLYMQALREADIPVVFGGMNNLFDSKEAEAARQLFYWIAGRENVTDATVRQAWEDANLGVEKKALTAGISLVNKLRDGINDDGGDERWAVYNIQRVFLAFLEEIGLREERVPKKRGEVVFYNLGRFSQLISDFETIHFKSPPAAKYKDFDGFLFYRADSAYPEGGQEGGVGTVDAVQIMTIHQAKGMQWPVVFVPALLRNTFPSPRHGGRSVWHILPDNLLPDVERYKGGIEDERRLFYVAATRSQRFLFMTWAPIAGKNKRNARASEFWEQVLSSKFVKRLIPDLSKKVRLPPEAKASVANVALSFSELKYFFECPYQFKLRVLYGFNAPLHEALGYGKSLHDTLAEVHQRAVAKDYAKPSEAAALVATHLHVPYAYTSLVETLQESATTVVEKYLHQNATELKNIEFSEKAIEISLGDGVSVAGRIDLVRRKDTGATTIVDLKSRHQSQDERLTDKQLHIYALGYRELTGRDADHVEIYNLDEGHRVPRSVDEELIQTVSSDIKNAAAALRTNTLAAQPASIPCERCDFKRLCSHAMTRPAKGK